MIGVAQDAGIIVGAYTTGDGPGRAEARRVKLDPDVAPDQRREQVAKLPRSVLPGRAPIRDDLLVRAIRGAPRPRVVDNVEVGGRRRQVQPTYSGLGKRLE